MFFLVDHTNCIIFAWSAKCGCSHIKNMFWFLTLTNQDYMKCKIHNDKEKMKLPDNIEDYTLIITLRNPFKRIVSGFLDKYKPNGQYKKKWKHPEITFSIFVNEVVINSSMIERHHFCPQTTEHYNEEHLMRAKYIKVFDIENIDYKYIEKLYNIEIPDSVIKFKGRLWENVRDKDSLLTWGGGNVYDDEMETYISFNVPYTNFYTPHIKEQVTTYYNKDFTLANKFGINYTV